METQAMFEKIMERLEVLENGNAEILREIHEVKAKLEEMAKGQLMGIIEQGERFMKELLSAKSAVEAHIHYEALRETVGIGKDDLQEILKDAFGDNEEVKQLVREKFKGLDKDLEAINENILRNDTRTHNGFTTVLQNQLSHFATLKELIIQTDKTVSDMRYTVDKIPTDRGLY